MSAEKSYALWRMHLIGNENGAGFRHLSTLNNSGHIKVPLPFFCSILSFADPHFGEKVDAEVRAYKTGVRYT